MLDKQIRGLISLYPRGVSNSQLLWRLKEASRAPSAEDILQALVALSDRGEIKRDVAGRWKLVALGGVAAIASRAVAQRADPSMAQGTFHALPLLYSQAQDNPDLHEEPAQIGPRRLPEPSKLFSYYAAAQRNDPRGRITLFPDGHAKTWQLVTTRGAWWEAGRLAIAADRLPDSLGSGPIELALRV